MDKMLETIGDLLAPWYLFLKSMHLLSVIAWMAGLLYLPRLFVYHAQKISSREIHTLFSQMEYRLIRIIMLPSMLTTFLFGGLLLLIPGIAQWDQWWIYLKLGLVFILSGLHGMMVSWHKAFRWEFSPQSERFFRLVNEIPFAIAIGIVFLVVLKPF